MRTGTKSLIFGAHCFFLHPIFVWLSYSRLYGTPWHPAVLLSIVCHDWGYWSCRSIDGADGERHVELGARIVSWLCDRERPYTLPDGKTRIGKWGQFCLFHSRFYAKRYGAKPSKLCVADKLAIAITPAWIYLPLVRLTGEIREYRRTEEGISADIDTSWSADLRWYRRMQVYMRQWVEEHRDGREDLWTSARSVA